MMVRNWVAHDKLLEQYYGTDGKLLKQLNNVQEYELKLLSCISTPPFPDVINDQKITEADGYVDNLLNNTPNVTNSNNYYTRQYLDKKGKPKDQRIYKDNFNQKINCLHNEKINIDLKYCYQQLLMQYFFVSYKKNDSDWLTNISNTNDFLPTLARHIYNRSFSSK